MLVQPCAPCVAVAEPMGPFRLEPRPRARAQWCSLSRRGPDTAGSRVDWMPLNRPVAWLEADLRLDGDYCRGSGPCRAPFIDRRLLSWWPWLRPDPSRGQWHIGEKNNAPILRALGKPWVVHHPPLQHVLQSKSPRHEFSSVRTALSALFSYHLGGVAVFFPTHFVDLASRMHLTPLR